MKKKYLIIIQFIVLLIIAIGFILYVFSKNNNIIEKFQSQEEYISPYFDIKYEYYKLNKEESPADIQVNPDTLILDIGGAFGQIDASKMPWDSENKELSKSEVLWGIVPGDATTALFRKMFLANQLQDLNSLPFHDDTNEFHYEDPMFQYGTDNQQLAQGLQAANGITQFLAPLIFGAIIGDNIEEAVRYYLKPSAKEWKNVPPQEIPSLDKALQKLDLRRFGKAKSSGAVSKTRKGAIEFLDNPMKKGEVPSFKSKFVVEGATKFSQKFAKAGLFKKVVMLIKKLFVNKATKLVAKGILVSIIVSTSLAWIPVVGPTLDAAYNFIVTPLLILLSLPDGPITKAMDKWADTEGTCPPGTTSLDQILPEGAEMLVSFVPIIGDIFDLFYPYLCSENGTGMLVTKGPYAKPKYMDYPWLSTYFWNWPEYNGRYKTPVVQGKYLRTEIVSSQSGYMGSLPKVTGSNAQYDLYNLTTSYSGNTAYKWDYYFNYDSVIGEAKTGNLNQVNKKLVGYKPEYTTQKFFPEEILPNGANFFWIDFSDPTLLAQMAQFYYDFSVRNPQINEDKTVSIEIISKINYVKS